MENKITNINNSNLCICLNLEGFRNGYFFWRCLKRKLSNWADKKTGKTPVFYREIMHISVPECDRKIIPPRPKCPRMKTGNRNSFHFISVKH